MNIYVANVPFETTEEDLQKAFGEYGQVASATVAKDEATGQSKGFAFVVMPTQAEAESAVSGMDGRKLGGRVLSVSEARPRFEGWQDGGRGEVRRSPSSRGAGGRGGGRRDERRGGGRDGGRGGGRRDERRGGGRDGGRGGGRRDERRGGGRDGGRGGGRRDERRGGGGGRRDERRGGGS